MKIQRIFHNTAARILVSLLLALAAMGPGTAAPHVARAFGPYVVDTDLDAPDNSTLDLACVSTLGHCTLRAAIEQATAEGGPTNITFAISMTAQTIVLSDTLGTIVWTGSNITVTGRTDAAVSGASLSVGKSLIEIQGSNNTLKGLILRDAPDSAVRVGDFANINSGNGNLLIYLKITGNDGPGIFVGGSAAGGGIGNLINYNYVGITEPDTLGCTGGEGNGIGILVGSAAKATQLNGNFVGCSAQDGVSLEGGAGAPTDTLLSQNRIGLNSAGAAIPNEWAGVSILGGTRGVTLANNYIAGNFQHGVYISGGDTRQITITLNNIGTDFFGNLSLPNGLDGIFISGLTAADTRINGNTIAGNGRAGIYISGSAGVTVTNNFIGLNPAGNSIMFNFTDGVKLDGGAHHNLIGGTQAAKNVISGNLGSGVLIDGPATTLNQVSGNYIGTNPAGTSAVPNLGAGVRLDHGANHNLVGSPTLATQRNVISGNAGDGVYFVVGAHDNTVDGNFIGLNAVGSGAIGNSVAGVAIIQSPSNAIGSAGATTGQYISGNGYQGIYVNASDATYIGWTNYIGVGLDLTTTLGNGSHGIQLNQATNSSVQAGLVANNHGAGAAVTGNSAAGNKIFFYIVRNNTGLPIDLNADGATPNDLGDADTGPNLLQNYPAITTVVGTVVTGTTCANCTVFLYRAYGNPAATGGGGLFIGTAFADGAGTWTYYPLPPGLTRLDLSASACDTATCVVSGNTSEMSPRWQLMLPVVLR